MSLTIYILADYVEQMMHDDFERLFIAGITNLRGQMCKEVNRFMLSFPLSKLSDGMRGNIY